MAQSTRIIDITKTFTPVDPQQVDSNRSNDGRDAYADKSESVVAYEGYNFLPTLVGYKSFFGTTQWLNAASLPESHVDKLMIFESNDYKNHLIALTETGIYLNQVNVVDQEWVHAIVLAAAPVGLHYEWTTAIIDDTLYAYRSHSAELYVMDKTFDGITVTAVVPTFLNMAEQIGIFKAGGRLGFWDSVGSVAWSNFDDHADFTPSITTLAGSAVFNEVRGIITVIQTFGDGFIIYATNSVVQVDRDLANTFQWNPSVLMAGNGVAYMEQVVIASPDTTHYAYTSIGLHEVTAGKMEVIATVVTDLLRESVFPVILRLLENRYLCLQLLDSTMIEGLIEYDATNYNSDPAAETPLTTFSAIVSLADIPTISEI